MAGGGRSAGSSGLACWRSSVVLGGIVGGRLLRDRLRSRWGLLLFGSRGWSPCRSPSWWCLWVLVLERRSNTALEGLWLLMYMQVATKERRISRKSRTEESRTTERRRKRSSRSRSSPASVFMPYRIRLTIFPSAAQHACGARVGAVWPL